MRFKKMICMVLPALMMVLFLGACTKSFSYTFHVETGDQIKIQLDTSEGYQLSQEEGTFTVSKEDTDILMGVFLTEEMYGQYLAALDVDEVEILAEAEHNGCAYTFYRFTGEDHVEHNYVCWVTGSSTGVLIAGVEEQQAVEAAFERLTFSVES